MSNSAIAKLTDKLKEKFPSKEEKLRRLELLRDQLLATREKNLLPTQQEAIAYRQYRQGIDDALDQTALMIKEGDL